MSDDDRPKPVIERYENRTFNFGKQLPARRTALAADGPQAARLLALRGGSPSEPDGSRAPAQKNVGRTFTRDVLRAFIAQSTHIDVVQEMLPGTE